MEIEKFIVNTIVFSASVLSVFCYNLFKEIQKKNKIIEIQEGIIKRSWERIKHLEEVRDTLIKEKE